MSCDGGTFAAKTGRALNCDAAEIGADVFLNNGFVAEGRVSLMHASITRNVIVEGMGGKLPKLNAGIDLEGARIGGGLFRKSVAGARRLVDLTEARVGSLRDDWAAWDGVGTLKLDGFTYDRV